ncbi:LacI family DNA-binding transcriptional regulator [Streptomyces sp. NPDC089919]|uniref:LacI family DNA-binding transcriptional regulator n=1 Tax=Streptomyces sp. NPDC089919 TaxID=3155188 RepID=UPI00342F001D
MSKEPTAPSAVTSADVARLAGVSRATVSFVLNNTQAHRVSEATRARVQEAAQQLGYVPHAAARSLRAGRSNLVLMPASVSAAGQLVAAWVDDLESELERHGYVLVLHAGRFADEVTAARAWAELRPVAVLALDGDRMSGRAVEVLTRAGVRGVVAFGAYQLPGAFTIGLDQAAIGALAARHLIDRRRNTIGVVMPQERGLDTIARPRLEGAERTAGRSSATVTPLDLSFSHESAAEVAAQVRRLRIDGVFAYNDEYAALLVHALRAARLRVPADVCVIGCDDLVLSALQQPPLTSVRLELPTPAQVADALHILIEGGTPPVVQPVEPVLVQRMST